MGVVWNIIIKNKKMIDLFNIKNLKELCEKYRLMPSKKYGQNFLISESVIKRMIEEADINENDVIVEIGPGFGPLTFALAKKAKRVIAFEIEKKLENYWEEFCPENVEIIWGNVLREIENQKSINSVKSYKVIANLPYQITSSAIRKFLEIKHQPSEMIFMVQKEVGERICAKMGEMSLLSVAVQFYAEPKILFNVNRTKFWPEPKVDSVIIKLKLKRLPFNTDEKEFFNIVKIGFSNKRKKLINNLKSLEKGNKKIKDIFKEIGLDINVRAQELDVNDWQKLADSINLA